MRAEQSAAACQSEASFVDDVLRDGPTPRGRVRKAVRILATEIRKTGERRIDTVEKVNRRSELLIVPDVFEVVVLGQVEVQTNRRELANLRADIEEGRLLQIRVCLLHEYRVHTLQRTSDIRQQSTDGRIDRRYQTCVGCQLQHIH